MSGMSMQAEPHRWQAWLDGQKEWFREDALRLYRDLEHRDPARVVSALNELSQRRYQRGLIAREIATVLEDPRPEIRRMGCRALASLGAKEAIADLLVSLEDPNPVVFHEAWTALKLITGADLPADSEVWARAYLAG